MLAFVFYTFFVQIRQIGNDEVAVKVSMDNSETEVVRGDVVFMPLRTEVYVYPTTIQTVKYDTTVVLVKDGLQFPVSPAVSYKVNAAKADVFYKNCGSSISVNNDVFLKQLVRNIYLESAAKFVSDSIVYDRNTFEASAKKLLDAEMDKVGLILVTANSGLAIPRQVQEVMSLRAKTLQDALIAENRLREVDALRREDSLRYSALTPLAIQKMFIDKWDGKLIQNAPLPTIYKGITEGVTDGESKEKNK